jgi:hypothetical protein
MGSFFAHITNPVFTGQPFTMAAGPGLAPKFALRKIRRYRRDKGLRPCGFEPFEYFLHTFTVFSSSRLPMRDRPGDCLHMDEGR